MKGSLCRCGGFVDKVDGAVIDPSRLDKIGGDKMLVSISNRVLGAEVINALEVHYVRNGVPKFFVYSWDVVA